MGDVGRTYELEVRRPREDHLPFLCHLNFTAMGGNFGDIIQVKELFRNFRFNIICSKSFEKADLSLYYLSVKIFITENQNTTN